MRDPQQASIQRFPVSLYASIDFLSGSLYNPYCSQVNYQEGHIDEADSGNDLTLAQPDSQGLCRSPAGTHAGREPLPQRDLHPHPAFQQSAYHHCGTAVCPAGRIQEPDQPQRRTADPTGHPLCQTGHKGPSAHPPDAQRAIKAADRLQEEIAVINHSVLADISEAEITQMAATMRKITERFQREESK